MAVHKVRLLRKDQVAAGTMSFHFEKPDGFEFQAGQCLSVSLIDPPQTDGKGNTRIFTIASAPYESELMLATRMRDSAFKRVLAEMPPASTLQIDGPYGNLVLDDDQSRAAVFLTGGIGVTPFLSMLRQAAHDGDPRRFYLFFSNRTPEQAPFLEQLGRLEQKLTSLTFVPTMTRSDKSAQQWAGEKGYVNSDMLSRHIEDLSAPVYYVVGPTRMALAMQKMLRETGIDKQAVRFEDFSGY